MLIDVEEARLIPEVPRGSAKPNQRPGRIPASTRTPPRARFQGRGRRKAPEGFPKPTFRSAKSLSKRRRRTTSSPLARFQGRRRRKAPGYSPERFRSREAPFNAPKAHHPSSPLTRFQGRKRRKAPEGFPKPTSRSAKREDVGVETFRGLPMGSQALTA